MKSILHFSIFLLVTLAQMQRCFAAPQSGDTTNTIQFDRERQAISIGPFIVGGDGKNTQTEQISNWIDEWLIPVAKIAAWPLVIIFIVLRFDKEIRRILENLKSIKGKDYSVEMSERLGAPAIIKAFDVIKDLGACLGGSGEVAAVNQFQFEGAPEA
jgi:hypothetical protein